MNTVSTVWKRTERSIGGRLTFALFKFGRRISESRSTTRQVVRVSNVHKV